MVPMISFVGKPDSGKTTLIENLIPVLKKRGYRVGVIKHTYHEVVLDTPGKDTDRFSKAGSDATALVTKQGMAMFCPGTADMNLEELASEYFCGFDIVIVEGYKEKKQPKIEVCSEPDGPLNEKIDGRVAVVSNHDTETDLPVFGHDDIEAIADYIAEYYLEKGSRSEVRMWVDGELIPMKPFVKAFVGQTVKGMVNALKGVKNPAKVRLRIGR